MSDTDTGSTNNTYPCGECAAPLTFQPGAAKLVCPFCGTENEIAGSGDKTSPWGERTADASIEELDYHAALSNTLDHADVEETTTIRCPGCGAEVGMD